MKLSAVASLGVCTLVGVLGAAALASDPAEEHRESVMVAYAIALVDRARPGGESPYDVGELSEELQYSLLAAAAGGAHVEYDVFPTITLMVDDPARMELPSSQEQRDLLAAALGVDAEHETVALQISVEPSAHPRSLGLTTALALEREPQGEVGKDVHESDELFRVRSESILPGTSLFVIPARGERQWVIVAQFQRIPSEIVPDELIEEFRPAHQR